MTIRSNASNPPSEEAIEQWRKNIRADTFFQYHKEMGIAITREGDLAVAAKHFELALAQKYESWDTHYRLIEVLKQAGRAEEADKLLTRARAAVPTFQAHARRRFGEEFIRDGKADLALEAFQASLVEEPGHADGLIGSAIALLMTEQPEQAEAQFAGARGGVATDLRFDLLERILDLGDAAYRRGDLDKAERFSRWATTLDPDLTEAHALLGKMMNQQSRYADAAVPNRRSVDLADYAADYWGQLGYSLINLPGRLTEGEECLQRAHALEPGNLTFRSFLRLAWSLQGRLPEVIAWTRKECEESPDRRLELAIHHMVGWDFPQAKEVLTEFLAGTPNHEVGRGYLATTELALGNTDQAIQILEQMLEGEPQDRQWLDHILAMCCLAQGNLVKAEHVISRSGVNDSSVYYNLFITGLVLGAVGRHADGVRKIEAAIAARPAWIWREARMMPWAWAAIEEVLGSVGFTATSFWASPPGGTERT